ncbi:MAG TPA: AmmeMemoRadiSam system protein B [Polyangiaceae bacterium]|nr:AmmeMemoRadiSam system protein B [Polyangiaceae bacterium]
MAGASVEARKPTAAGVSYPADREELAATVRDLLARAEAGSEGVRTPRAIVVPHAIRGTAGEVAAAAWARVAPVASRIARVLLLGPAHHAAFAGIAAPFADAFATPLGPVAVDRLAIEGVRRFPQVVVSDVPHEQEPSLEVQLPFVQALLEDKPMVPLLVGDLSDEEASEVVGALWDDTTLVVVSTDMSHYFDAPTARGMDESTALAIEALDASAIAEENACGHAALRALLLAARERKLRASRVDLRHSGETTGELDEVVGYGAFVIG